VQAAHSQALTQAEDLQKQLQELQSSHKEAQVGASSNREAVYSRKHSAHIADPGAVKHALLQEGGGLCRMVCLHGLFCRRLGICRL